MKLATLGLLACLLFVNAQYLSEGWKPGQEVHTVTDAAPADPTYTPVETSQPKQSKPLRLSQLFDINRLLTSDPAVAMFSKFGINITERVQLAFSNKLWDERVPLITDHNYKDIIVNEQLTEQEEKDRVWMIVISSTSSGQEGVSKFLDEVFDNAYNETQVAGDLPNVRWGRIDYLNVTHITTKWNIWQAPYLVILKDRGQSLRFYRPQHLRLRPDSLREFLAQEGWTATAPWKSIWGPGGEREWLMDHFATVLTKIYNWTVVVPRWILLLISGTVGSILINLMHKPGKQTAQAVEAQKRSQAQEKQSVEQGPAPVSAPATDSEGGTSGQAALTPKRTTARQRKAAK
ncbi:hypothetical protein K443DRAFT_92621 [Laccaria amethystina LaAM-08-1]|uniref:Thioredoxin-like fold domain-containing protein n=1 Tax=Laccaria amethystina LaAM-08-1 TaxID=1095629 RepID=A0A0C9XIA6_9AGAR|nr:hypothetical protein K443DRAFT_92621 [Laccaria amethystina LaAM-08-1]